MNEMRKAMTVTALIEAVRDVYLVWVGEAKPTWCGELNSSRTATPQ